MATEVDEKKTLPKTRSRLLPASLMMTLPDRMDPEDEDPMLHARLFLPTSGWTWYLADARCDRRQVSKYDDDILCMAFVQGDADEWGTISIRELEALEAHGYRVERDSGFRPCRWSEIQGDTAQEDSVRDG